MATYRAVAATGKAIQRLLTDARPREFADATIRLLQAKDFQSEPPVIQEGISIYLYRVATNPTRRNLPSHSMSTGSRRHPSLPLDLFFLLTPWSADAETQLRLLGWAMRVLEDTPFLSSGLLNAAEPEATIFNADETVELVYDPLSLQDTAVIWENLRTPRIQPSATYVARMVLLDFAVGTSSPDLLEAHGSNLVKRPA